MNSWGAWLFATGLMVAGVFTAQSAWRASIRAEAAAQALTHELALRDKASLKGQKLLENITFGWYSGYSDNMRQLNVLSQQAETYRALARRQAGIFLVLVAVGLAAVIFFLEPGFFAGLLGLSLIALFAGLVTPVFSLVAYKDVPVLGQVVFQYESKSLLTALVKLWQQGQHGVAVLIFSFTVVVPVLKTALMTLLLMVRRWREHPGLRKIRNALEHLGKWSMLDVFVVAIVVVWFSLREKGSTDAQLQVGLYFFALYVLSSMVLMARIQGFFSRNKFEHGAPE